MPTGRVYELSAQQKSRWERDGGEEVWQALVEVHGPWSSEEQRAALQQLVENTETFRTTYVAVSGLKYPVQNVEAQGRVAWSEVADLDLEREASALAENGGHVRVAVKRETAGHHTVLLSVRGLSADEASVELLLEQWSNGGGSEESTGYTQYSAWQKELETSDEGVAYWAAVKAQSVPLQLPFEGCEQRGRAMLSHRLSERVAQRWQEYENPGAVLLAVWQPVLWRLTGEKNTAIAVRLAGREFEELRSVAGPIEKWAPLICACGENLSLEDATREASSALRVAEGWSADLEEGNECGVSFAYRPRQWSARRGLLQWELKQLRGTASGWKICLVGVGSGQLELHYDRSALTNEAASRLLGFVGCALGSGLSNLLSEQERACVMQWSGGRESAGTLPNLLERMQLHAQRHGTRLAVVSGEEQLSYAELDEQSNRLARWLVRQGARQDECVGLCVSRGVAAVIGMWGIWKAGGAYVALDGEHPGARLRQQTRAAGLRVIVSERKYAGQWEGWEGTLLYLDSEEWKHESGEDLRTALDPEQLAYVIYTSGSTGVPKGVGVSHGNLWNYVAQMERQLGVGSDDHWQFASVTTLCADLGHTALWVGWGSGGTVHLVDYQVATDARRFSEYMSRNGVDVLKMVPSHLRALLGAGANAGILPQRKLVLGGEALSADLVRQVYELGGSCQVINHYGPTEATVGALTHAIAAGAEGEHGIPLGSALGGVRAYVVDETGQLAARGVKGELLLGGAGIARGYVGEAGQTAERFIPDVFSADGGRLYRTGDLVRWRPDGLLEYLGRKDQQVKLRGYRVELGEIESVLRRQEDVRDAAVILRHGAAGEPFLAAYVVPDSKRAEAIEGRVRYRLPNNLAVAHINQYETDFFYRQIFEDRNNLRHGIQLPDNAIVFDAGANIGLFTVYVAQACKNPRIFAFEPLPPIYETLRVNAGVYAPEATLFECGLSNSSRTARFSYYPQSTCMSGYYGDAESDHNTLLDVLKQQTRSTERSALSQFAEQIAEARSGSQSFLCEIRRLSDVIRETRVDRIDLLKIDVEKSELDVLQGIDDEHWPLIAQIAIEAHAIDDRLTRIERLLTARGYHVVIEQDTPLRNTGLYNVYAVRHDASISPSQKRAPDAQHPAPEPFLTANDVHARLQDLLPSYMIPSEIVMLDALPLTANGKLDRASLPDRKVVATHRGVPLTWEQEILSSIWAEVLGLPVASIDDNFFSLGGDSLRSIQIVSRAQERGISISLAQLHEHPTIAKLSAAMRGQSVSPDFEPPAPLSLLTDGDRVLLQGWNVEDAFPLSMLQAGMLFHSSYNPETAVFLDMYSVTLRADFNEDALRQSVLYLVACHPMLRAAVDYTSFSEPVQIIRHSVELPFAIHDLRHTPSEQHRQVLDTWRREERRRPFDTATGPLWRMDAHCLSSGTFQFTFTFHHSILDGWSVASLLTELFECYTNRLSGIPIQLQSPASLFRDFVAAERKELQDPDSAAFWKRTLESAIPSLLPRWPGYGKDSADQGCRERNVPIEPAVSEALLALARKEAVPVKTVLLAAHLRVLTLLTGRNDVVTGLISNGRLEQKEGERTLGLFLNTLPFRMNVPKGTWRDLVHAAFELERAMVPHRRYPLAQMLRTSGSATLFETVFNFTRYHVYERLKGFNTIEVLGGSIFEQANFPLVANFGLDPGGARVHLTLKCNTSELAPEQLDAFAVYYGHALGAMAQNPDAINDRVELLSPSELRQQLVAWNATEAEFDRDCLIDRRWEERVRLSPDAVAAGDDQRNLTYRDIDDVAGDLALRLQAHGIGPNRPVAIWMERGVDMIVAMLGILKAGGAYVPLDPRAPSERIQKMIEMLPDPVVISHEPLKARWREISCPVWDVSDRVSPGPETPETTQPGSSNDLAYIIFTSGSTAEPKGVTIDHRSVVNLVTGLDKCVFSRYEGPQQVALVASYVFDASVQQIFASLLLGHTVWIASAETVRDGKRLIDFFQRHRITITDGTPGTLGLLLSAPPAAAMPLRHAIIGGEALSISRAQAFRQRFGLDIGLTNIYGPAECCVDSTAYTVEGELPPDCETVPIGAPLANKRVYVLDAERRLLPIGVRGEIYIAGVGLSPGYLGANELTSERFLADPYHPQERMYKTGDVGRWLPDGNIEFLGRLDDQVKIRGHRIELREIEAALQRHPLIRECVVVARKKRKPSTIAVQPLYCERCSLASNVPGVRLDETRICNVCRDYERHKEQASLYFQTEADLLELVRKARAERRGGHDCLLLFSGGKDSTYVLHRLVDLGLRVMTFTFDNGFISASAFRNIDRTTRELGIEHVTLSTGNMKSIFAESLRFNSTVCSGCFKALTTISTKLAIERRINVVVTGLSRGQIYDTKLAAFFERRIFDVENIESQLGLFRKMYHAGRDAMSNLLEEKLSPAEEETAEHMYFVDFFRYCDISKPAVIEFLRSRSKDWERPEDTGFCSTNCRMNDIGIHVHMQNRGYHNYAIPLSWDVRLGHITREAAVQELSEVTPGPQIGEILHQIGYQPESEADGEAFLCAYFVPSGDFEVSALRDHLRKTLPEYMLPSVFVKLDRLPMTINGKVDKNNLPEPARDLLVAPESFRPPETYTETVLAELWKTLLSQSRIGVNDDFFALGGHSLLATQLASRIRQTFRIELPLRQLFETSTLLEQSQAIDRAREKGFPQDDTDAIEALPRDEDWVAI
jgi:amino acid adenylation domain-containing protein/FkbM family methyltransferase